jgi:hypothetical protein
VFYESLGVLWILIVVVVGDDAKLNEEQTMTIKEQYLGFLLILTNRLRR